jgi:hypothetical protein
MTLDTTPLTVGPLRVFVEASNPTVHTALRSAYGDFVTDRVSVPYTLTVHVDYTPGSAPADWPFTFDRGVLHFTAEHYLGSIAPGSDRSPLNVIAPHPFGPVDYFVRSALALLAFEAGGLLFHAAGLVRRGNGYAFFGYSGSGKTTVARLSSDALILNDDLVVLLPDAAHWNIHATPFSNLTQVTSIGPHHAPLQALYRLVQDRNVHLEPIDRPVAIAEVVASSPIVSADPDRALALLARADRLVNTVLVQRLHFLPDPSFWAIIQP